ncbi:MAG: sialate O-acetylesterase [Planctomycetes bacterium]|nr:sialate O-acetylesterase [Planctomycetota bacterium]
MRPVKAVLLAAVASVLALGTARADVKPHPIFSNNMVLQQGTDVVVWGKADPDEAVGVELTRKTTGAAAASGGSTKADKDGNWKVKLGKQEAGTGYALKVKGAKNTVEFTNVAVGEVWVCSGQSNMQWEFWRGNLGEQSKTVPAASKNPNIRLMTLQRVTATTPQYAFPVVTVPREGTNGPTAPQVHYGTWLECDQPSVQEFSVVAYYFGRDLEKALKVPVGLIVNSWGGMPCEAYTSLEALDAEPSLKYLADRARAAAKQFEADKKPAGPSTPTVLYNSMIHPIINFPVKGAIWYQGESNTGRAYEYRTLFPTMIKDWRARWHSDLPFMAVQLAPFGNGKGNSGGVTYAELRDAQLHATKVLPKVGLAVITDAGNETDIHPAKKEPAGARLALAARALAYGEKIVYSGPLYKDVKFASGAATLSFDSVGGGLVAKDGDLVGFTIAGKDGKFVPAKATIKGDTVVVSSEMVPGPTAVRYGWVNFASPTLNLFNKEGLPASPFRTDDLPLTTMPKPKN